LNNVSQMQSLRDILICVVVGFGIWLLLAPLFNLISAAVVAILLYFVLKYRSKVKELQGHRVTRDAGPTEAPSSYEP